MKISTTGKMSKPWSCRWFLGGLILAVLFLRIDSCLNEPGFLQLDFPDRHDFEIGSDVRIECRLLNNTVTINPTNSKEMWHARVDQSNLRFRWNGQPIEESSGLVEKVDENTIAFTKKNAAMIDNGAIICHGLVTDANNDTVTLPGCTTSISVGTPPKQPLDFKCTSISFNNMTCTWKKPPNKVLTKYTLEISFGVSRTFGQSWNPCPPDTATPTSCSWTASTNPAYDKMAEKFFFRINGTNGLGSESWYFNRSHGSIVKLSPVKYLELVAASREKVGIKWVAPDETKHGGWKEKLSIEYNVSIDRLNSTDSLNILTKDTNFEMEGLLPNNWYRISVRARTTPFVRFDLDSDPVSIDVSMPKDKPDKPPTLLRSAFKYKLFNSVRTVTLLFSEIPPKNWNDDHFKYIVQVCSRADQICYNKTVEHTNVDLEDLSVSKLYYIDVWSSNSLGESPNSSGLVIHPQSELLALPTNVEDELGNRMATLRWRTPPLLAQLALEADVFWCLSYDKRRCQGEIFSATVENNDSYRIEVNDTRDYIYGVALTDAEGRTSGSVWSVCEINPGAHVGQVRELEALSDTETTLQLKWKTGCGYQRKNVAGYQVEYCKMEHLERDVLSYSEECQHQRPSNVSASCHLLNFTVPTEEDVYVLKGLETGEVYRVVLRAIDNVTSKFAPDSVAVCMKAQGRGLSVLSLIVIAVGSAIGFTVVILVVTMIAKHMGGEFHSTKTQGVHLPSKTGKVDKRNPPRNRGTEMKVIESNGIHPDIDAHMTSAFNHGSHSGLDKLITTPSTLESLMRSSGESPNLKGEPQIVLNMEPPSVAALVAAPSAVSPAVLSQPIPNGGAPTYPATPMPPYTQLGLSSTHFVAAPEQPRNTGYSQLTTVIPNDPPDTEGDDDEGDDPNGHYYEENGNDEARAPSPEPPERLPPSGPNPGYVACNAAANIVPKPAASSNGYVPAVITRP